MPKIIKSKKDKKKKNKPQSQIVIYFLSVIKGFGVSATGLLLISFLQTNGKPFTVFTKIIIFIAISAGAMLSSYISQKRLKGRGIVNGLISSGIYLLFYIIVIAVIMRFQFNSNLLLLVPVIFLSGVVGGILSANS